VPDLTRPGQVCGMTAQHAQRVLTDWTLNAVTPAEPTSLDVITARSVPLDPDQPRT
jgi:hypothetical protein